MPLFKFGFEQFLKTYNLMKTKKFIISIIALVFAFPVFMNGQTPAVRFSVPGGFYNDGFAVEISSNLSDVRIFYTLNGDTPTVHSKLYTQPLLLDRNLFSSSRIFTIHDCVSSQFYLSGTPKKCIVIRAAAFDSHDNIVGSVVTNSYFLKSLGCDVHGLPVVSIAVDSVSLFDYDTGIFVPGSHFDPTDPTHTGNYYMKGDEWERRCNVEFYESGNRGINQIAGLKARGGASRAFQQKGLKLLAREKYGQSQFYYRFFDDITLAKFKRLSLKPFRCSNWVTTGGQEYICQKIARDLDIDGLAIRQVALFINGEYWGIYSLEETPDEHYLEDRFGANPDSCNLLKYWGVPEHGSGESMWSIRQWLQSVSLADSANYEHISTLFDISNFIDYWMFEIFACNVDWPANNALIWQEIGSKWRCILYDLDGCFVKDNFDGFGNAIDTIGAFPASNATCTFLFRKLLESESFRKDFCDRYYELKQNVLSYSNMHRYLEEYANLVSAEIPSQAERFGFPNNYVKWQNDMDFVDNILRSSNQKMEQAIFEYLHYIAVDEKTASDFVCFPNPFHDELHLSFGNKPIDANGIEIYDLMGRMVYLQRVSSESSDFVSVKPELTSGAYILRIGDVSRLIIKE